MKKILGYCTIIAVIAFATVTQAVTVILTATDDYGETSYNQDSGTRTFTSTSKNIFTIGANGVNNKIYGSGPAVFNGTFEFNLAGASTNAGSGWTIVDVTSQSFGSTFSVGNATGATVVDNGDGSWSLDDAAGSGGKFLFNESDGTLSAVDVLPEVSPQPKELDENFESYRFGPDAPFIFTFGSDDATIHIVNAFDGRAVNFIQNTAGIYEYTTHPIMASNASTAATAFFQVSFADFGSSDSLFALSADGAGAYGDMNIMFRVPSDGVLETRDGGIFMDTEVTVTKDTVYNFWIVMNNSANTWQLYTSTGTNAGAIVAQSGDASTVNDFRNTADTTIDTFYFGMNGGSDYTVDNLYVSSGSDTSYPFDHAPAGPLAGGGFVGPYTNDANTVYLFHLDESAGSSTAAWDGSGAGTGAYSVDQNATEVTDVLGASGFLGHAANMMGSSSPRGIGIDVDSPSNGFEYDDRVDFSTIISNNQFTLEALIRPSVAGSAAAGEIWSMDDNDASRGFQFKLNGSEQLEWHPINLGGTGPVTASVGPIESGMWYHLALTYSNGYYSMYWTPVSTINVEAILLKTWYSPLTTTSLTAPLVLGNEGRDVGGMNEAFPGLIDEARISNVARRPFEFIVNYTDTDGDGLPDLWESQIVNDNPGDAITSIVEVLPGDDYDGDGFTNQQEYDLGLNPTTANAADTDTDGDYLPDLWEFSKLGGITYNSYDDPDNDGYNNQAERIAGTDPMIYADHPSWQAPTVAFLSDSIVTNDALLMAGGAGYGRGINGSERNHTFDGYQYSAYYDTHGTVQKVCLARRSVNETAVGEWEIVQTDSEFINGDESGSDNSSAWDGHNYIALGICPADGTLHIAWDHHGSTLRYRKSVVGLCTTNKAAWGPGMLGAEQNWLEAPGQTETLVTYPQFTPAPGSGLMFNRRDGYSGDGDQYLQFYNPSTGAWSAKIKFLSSEGTYVPYNSSTSRCAYINGLDFGPDGTIHVTWTWREDWQSSNHDICYAYSPDNGTNWYNNAGDLIADTSLGETISLDTPGIIIKSMDMNQLLINQQAQCVDNDGRVHILMLHRREDPGYEYPNFSTSPFSILGVAYYHYFRDPDTGKWTQRRIPPTPYPVGSRPNLGFDAAGNVYAVYQSFPEGTGDVYPGQGAGPLVVSSASKASGYTDWQVRQVIHAEFEGAPRLDRGRLLNDGIIALQVQENSDTTSEVGTPLHILEFALEVPEPANASEISFSTMGDDVLIGGLGQTNKTYQLQVSTDLVDTNGWVNVGPEVSGKDGLIAIPDPAALQNDRAFYKVLSTSTP